MVIETIPIEALKPHAKNARKHSQEQIDALARNIERFGFTTPVLIDEKNRVIAGHGRILAMQKLERTEVPCVRIEGLTDEEINALRLADNQIASMSEWDEMLLAESLQELSDELRKDTGFNEKEITSALNKFLNGEEDDFDTTPPVTPKTKTGDLWVLGDHRLLCGDSTKREDVERLMGGERADICFTSPPYGAGNVAKLRAHGTDDRKSFYNSHDDGIEAWPSLMRGWLSAVSPSCEAVVCNVQMLADNKTHLIEWIYENVSRLVDIIVWDKNHGAPQMAENVLSNAFEFIVVFGGNGSRSIPFGDFRGVSNVVRIDPHGKNENADVHGAVFPIALPVWVMTKLCGTAKSIIDPFSGSFSTLIACEQVGRKFYGIEIDPKYCDVGLERWAKLTGKDPVREDGVKWSELV